MSKRRPIPNGINFFNFIPKISEEEIQKIHKTLYSDASFNTTYLVLTISACLIATFGLISNSTAVIIGAMLVAPLMLPLRALAFGALKEDFKLIHKALISLIAATIIALFLSWLLGSLLHIPVFRSEVISRTKPQIIDLGIAITAGGLSGFGKIKKGVNDAIAGTAIAVALMPPLCVIGLSFSQHLYAYSQGALLLYITNLLGITFACMIVFILTGYVKFHTTFIWNVSLLILLLLPLGGSFLRMVKQQQIQAEITNQLIQNTITVGRDEVSLVQVQVFWNQKPTLVYVIVHTDDNITSKEVQLVEDYLSQKIQQPLKLVFTVNRVRHITSDQENIRFEKISDFDDQHPHLIIQQLLKKNSQ